MPNALYTLCAALLASFLASTATSTAQSISSKRSPSPRVSGHGSMSHALLSRKVSVRQKFVQLISVAEEFGPFASERYQQALRIFVDDPQALEEIKRVFAIPGLPAHIRQKSIYFAGSLPGHASISFLSSVAQGSLIPNTTTRASEEFEPPRSIPVPQAEHVDAAGDTFRLRIAASVELAKRMASGNAQASDALLRELRESEVEIARVVGLELYIRSILKGPHLEALRRRGIPSNFRKLDEVEFARLMTEDVESGRAPDNESAEESHSSPPPVPEGSRQ